MTAELRRLTSGGAIFMPLPGVGIIAAPDRFIPAGRATSRSIELGMRGTSGRSTVSAATRRETQDGIAALALAGAAPPDIRSALATFGVARRPRTARMQDGSLANTWLKSPENADWVDGDKAWEALAPAA